MNEKPADFATCMLRVESALEDYQQAEAAYIEWLNGWRARRGHPPLPPAPQREAAE